MKFPFKKFFFKYSFYQFFELDSKFIRFCETCTNFLQNVLQFREQCISSFEFLRNKFLKEENFLNELSQVKSEATVFVQELPVQTVIDDYKFKFSKKKEVQYETEVLYCNVCFEVFHDKKKFKKHMRLEKLKASDVLLFCDICGYSSKRKCTLSIHMQNKQWVFLTFFQNLF